MNKHFQIASMIMLAMIMLMMGASCATDEAPKDTTVNYWDSKKGNCNDVLVSSYAYGVDEVARCTKLWETYRYVDELPINERSVYAVAFSKVSYEASNPYDKAIADAALARICIPRHPMSGGKIVEQQPDSLDCTGMSVSGIKIGGGTDFVGGNPYAAIKGSVEIGEVSSKDQTLSNKKYKEATKNRKKSIDKAIRLYEEALDANPYNIDAKYDLASAYAINNDEVSALKQLEELNKWNDPSAERAVERARTDDDFTNIRDNPNFKLLTGFIRVDLANGAKTAGVQKVAQMKDTLEKRRFPVTKVFATRTAMTNPQIWYRTGFDAYADQIRQVLGLSKVPVKMMDAAHQKQYPSDVLVVYGDPSAAYDGLGQNAPVVQGERAKGSDNKLDDLVKSVNDSKKSVDNARDSADSLTSW